MSIRLGVGAGPVPGGGPNTLFLSATVDVADGGNIEQDLDFSIDVPAFSMVVRFFLQQNGVSLRFIPQVEADVFFDKVDDIAGAEGEEEKAGLEAKLSRLASGKFIDFLKTWLVGGRRQIASIRYEPSPGDVPRADGIVERATGKLILGVVGPKPKPIAVPVLQDPTTGGGSAPVDDGSIQLFDLPDEEPEPDPADAGGPGGGSLTPFGTGGGPRPSIGPLAKIDHIVVLMQENRSFDQVLGYLRRDRINPEVDGLLPPDDPGAALQSNFFNGRTFPVQKADVENPRRERATAWPSFGTIDPGHGIEDVFAQMSENMGGFVRSFAERLGVVDPLDPRLRLVMDYFGPDDLEVYAALAREFGIFDSWYTAHAGPTWPNRFVFIGGDLNVTEFGIVETNNPDISTMLPIQRPTLFDHLNEAGVSWRVFEHGYSFLRLFANFTFDTENIVPFDDPVRGFEFAARHGLLPSFTLIEPDYIDLPPGNDDHPPSDMKFGQDLVNRIVRALIDSPAFQRTLFVITYDEHGGFYDHKQPPDDAPPLGGNLNLRKLGPRVPAFAISPLVERKAVFHSRFDHTSVGATVLRRFVRGRVPRVSPRMDTARDLREVLTLANSPRPRTDFGSLGLPPLQAPRFAPERRSVPERAARVKPLKGVDDFHSFLAAMRLITGEPPKSSTLRRRQARRMSGELLYYRDRTRDGTGDVANPTLIGQGGWNAFRHLFSSGDGAIYAVDQAGRLLFFRDKTQDGTGDVANPSVIGQDGWQNLRFLFSGGNGILYAVVG
jgi:phospholipase C